MVVLAIASVAQAAPGRAQREARAEETGAEGAAPAPPPIPPAPIPRVVNISSAFAPGPYTALAIDPTDPRHVGVGNSDGSASWSLDAGVTGSIEQVIQKREYSFMVLRGEPRYPRFIQKRPDFRGAGRLFVATLRAGLVPTRWAIWMSHEDIYPDVLTLALPPGGHGRVYAGGPWGLHLSDTKKSVFTKAMGVQRPKQTGITALSSAVDPQNPKHVLVGTDRGLMVSTDGGFTWRPHAQKELTDKDDPVYTIQFDPAQPGVVVVATGWTVYQSQDGGNRFEAAFGANGFINAVSIGPAGALVATAEGLYVSNAQGGVDVRWKGENIVGAIPLDGEKMLVASDHSIFVSTFDGQRIATLMNTHFQDPFQKMLGTREAAYVISKFAAYRLGPPALRGGVPAVKSKVTMSLPEVEDAVAAYWGIPRTSEAKLADRWYAKLAPRFIMIFEGNYMHEERLIDDATFPISFRYFQAFDQDRPFVFQAWATWDLSKFAFGEVSNVSNPFAFLESRLRPIRADIMTQIRWRYREAVNLVQQLQRPPSDIEERLMWRLRLEEHAAYLAGMTGKKVIVLEDIKEFR